MKFPKFAKRSVVEKCSLIKDMDSQVLKAQI